MVLRRRKPYISLILLLIAACASACSGNQQISGKDGQSQSAPGLLPEMMAVNQAIRERIYTLDHRRGALVPTKRWFQQAAGQLFTVYRGEPVSVNGQMFQRLQVAIDPVPQFILLKDSHHIAPVDPIAPDYQTFSRAACPLLTLSSTTVGRLEPASWLPAREQVFLFGSANHPFAFEYNGASTRYWYANIAIEDEWGNLTPNWWIPWTCLDHPTPWHLPPREDVVLAALGEPGSPFTSELGSRMQVPWNLLASPREYQRIAGEKCADIMNGLPETEYALINGFLDEQGGEEQIAVPVFVCGELDQHGQVAYRMRPDHIEIPTQEDGVVDEIFLLVINLSPHQMIAFGALAYDVEGFFAFRSEAADDTSADVFLVRPGVANAIWIVLDLYSADATDDIIYAAGPADQEYLYEASTWIEEVPAMRGRIKRH